MSETALLEYRARRIRELEGRLTRRRSYFVGGLILGGLAALGVVSLGMMIHYHHHLAICAPRADGHAWNVGIQ